MSRRKLRNNHDAAQRGEPRCNSSKEIQYSTVAQKWKAYDNKESDDESKYTISPLTRELRVNEQLVKGNSHRFYICKEKI